MKQARKVQHRLALLLFLKLEQINLCFSTIHIYCIHIFTCYIYIWSLHWSNKIPLQHRHGNWLWNVNLSPLGFSSNDHWMSWEQCQNLSSNKKLSLPKSTFIYVLNIFLDILKYQKYFKRQKTSKFEIFTSTVDLKKNNTG